MSDALQRLLLVVLLALLTACGGEGEEATPPAEAGGRTVRLVLDKRDPERLLRYYFAGYAAPGGADPVAAGLLRLDGGAFHLDRDALARRHPTADARLDEAAADGVLDWDELAAFFQATYYAARDLPPTLDDLYAAHPALTDPDALFTVEVDGVMTTARRSVAVPRADLRAALGGFSAAEGRLVYPVGTVFVGGHVRDGATVETTAMRKRPDGAWDFFAYDREGRLTAETLPPPRALNSPTQCVGCHFGDRLFEPERSFPGPARPGPHGPRAVYVPDGLRTTVAEARLVRHFDEHRRRSDGVLGLYGTLFTAQLLQDRRAGRLPPEDAALLEGLDLPGGRP